MSFKTIKANIKDSLNGYQVSGKSIQYHSGEFAYPGQPLSGLTATGGVISDYTDGDSVYRAHIFTSSGTFTVSALGEYPAEVDYLLVAGGGSGGFSPAHYGGGGGAGGLLSSHPDVPTSNPIGAIRQPSYTVSASPGAYNVVIGGGGAAVAPGSVLGGLQGGNTDFYPAPVSHPSPTYLRAIAGGGGGARPGVSGDPGGSGGGAGESSPSPGHGTGTTNQGTPGGHIGDGEYGPTSNGKGGGGALTAGNTKAANAGGDGLQVKIAGPTNNGVGGPGPSPINAYFAGGGGGAGNAPAPAGGFGGGGTGGAYNNQGDGGHGLPGTGGGGGGGVVSDRAGGGGSGICIIRYKIGSISSAKATGGSISYYNGKTIHTFTSSGTFVNPASIDNVEVVMVAGGGSGGLNIGGGGGAGAVLESPGSGFTFPNNTYTITVGAGGGGVSSLGPATANTASNTTISYPGPYTWTAQRGGYGGSYPDIGSQPGGSGGGGTPDSAPGGTKTAADSPTPIGTLTAYGNAGGTVSANYQGGGGGGAGGAGSAQPSGGIGGAGGIGRQLPTTFRDPRQAPSDSSNPQPYQRGGGLGTPGPAGSYYVAAGGGGASYPSTNPVGGAGGAGGGGIGGGDTVSPPATDGQSAVANTGSGGGGSGYSPTAKSTAGSGGSGIVLIAYPT